MGPFESQVLSLTELFDKPFPLNWNSDKTQATFELPDTDNAGWPVGYFIDFKEKSFLHAVEWAGAKYKIIDVFLELGISIDEYGDDDTIGFEELDDVLDDVGFSFWELSFRDHWGGYGVTGDVKEQASKLFATVIAAFNEFMKTKRPDFLYFTANEPSRKRLYKTMARKTPPGVRSQYAIVDARGDGSFTAYVNKQKLNHVKKYANNLLGVA